MARKKKQTKKYAPRNEFRRNNSPSGMGHPAYVFGETEKSFKSFGLTTNPNDRERKIELPDNPDPNSQKKAYIRIKPVTINRERYSAETFDWRFSDEDMAIVRHLRKDYKRRAYRRQKKKKK